MNQNAKLHVVLVKIAKLPKSSKKYKITQYSCRSTIMLHTVLLKRSFTRMEVLLAMLDSMPYFTSVQYNDFKGLVIWPNSHFS